MSEQESFKYDALVMIPINVNSLAILTVTINCGMFTTIDKNCKVRASGRFIDNTPLLETVKLDIVMASIEVVNMHKYVKIYILYNI